MWFCPEEYKKKDFPNLNKHFLQNLNGELDEREARVTLIDFLRNNLGLSCELLTGIKLAPYQELTIRAMMNRNYSMCVWGRGCGKTFVAAMYCLMQAILENNSRIIIAGPTFRTSRFIFNKIEEVLQGKNAGLARQAFGDEKEKRNDIHMFKLANGSSIAAIPLNGEKIRGFRANIIVIDEYLLMSREIIDTVLIPFMTAPQDIGDRQKIIEREEEWIKQGLMKESERKVFEDKTKLIALSSASYTFENLYVTYCDWMKKIYNAGEVDENYDLKKGQAPPKYFISQMSWNSIPPHMMNRSIIKEAESGGTSNAVFTREYCGQFSDGSEGYFSAKKMMACSIPDGQTPTLEIVGSKESKYIISIDANASNSPTSDDFAMSVIELDERTQSATLVHAYGEHGKDMSEHVKYFFYLYTHFNVEMVVIDNAGADTFISACNESRWFRDKKIELRYLDFDPAKDAPESIEELKNAKRQINKTIHRNVVKIVFSNNDWIRKSNEYLQGCIDIKKIWFASNAKGRASTFEACLSANINHELLSGTLSKDEKDAGFSMDVFLEMVNFKIALTKKECAMIEVKSNNRGTQSFDLPLHLLREKGEARARRDNYTSLLLAVWGMKLYYEMASIPEEQQETFQPFWI
jgi:hypothetical protein